MSDTATEQTAETSEPAKVDQATPTQQGTVADSDGSAAGKPLEVQQKELQDKKRQQAAEQVDATLAEIGKVIDDQKKALEDYTDEVVAELTDAQDLLKHKFDHLKKQLEGELGAAKAEVNKVVREHNADLAAARAAVDCQHDTPVYRAEKEHAKAVAERDAAAAALAGWRKPKRAIEARQKLADNLVKEITALATPETHKYGEAYWKLGLEGTELVAGQPYLEALINGPPQVVPAAALIGKILEAWDAFQAKRIAAEEASQALAKKLKERKEAEDEAVRLDKTLITSIVEALGDREEH